MRYMKAIVININRVNKAIDMRNKPKLYLIFGQKPVSHAAEDSKFGNGKTYSKL